MKNVSALLLAFFATVFSMNANSVDSENYYGNYYNGSSYIFEEGGVEFSVFPDGQFDFVYLGQNQGNQVNVSVNTPGVSINFNSGYNYDTYVQYDNYGAVIQVENVPIYYDEFGRISRAGRVDILYNDRRIVRVGGLQVFYNNYGYFSHCSGFISPWYTTYIYRPWHAYYMRPIYSHCVVYDHPYRQYYYPYRYSYAYHSAHYHRGYQNYRNARHDFYRPGSRMHYKDGRTVMNNSYRGAKNRSEITSRGGRNNEVARSNSSAQRGRPAVQGNNYNKETTARGNRDGNQITKGRPVSSSRPSTAVANNTKERPTVTKQRPTQTKGRPTVSRDRPSVSKGRPAIAKEVTRKNNRNANASIPAAPKRSKSVQQNTRAQVQQKSSGTKSSRTNSPRKGRG